MKLKTKILATLGPSTASETKIRELIKSGVNVFRFNLKHNVPEWHLRCFHSVKEIAKEENVTIATFFDLQGPSLRTGVLPNDVEFLDLINGDFVALCKDNPNALGQAFITLPDSSVKVEVKWIPFDHVHQIEKLEAGHEIYLVDGLIELKVVKDTPDAIYAKVINGAKLGNRRNVNIPKAHINMPSLTEKDKEYVKLAIEYKVDVIALSFVRNAKDVNILRQCIKSFGGDQHINSKIETLKSIENIEEIIDASDSITIARGDLGVEIQIERIPKIQKKIIVKCRERAKPVIVATQMLKSMTVNPVPTRAEVADVANAVLDRTDCLWLSEETASGDYPIKAVNVLSKIAKFNENFEYGDIEFHEHHDNYQELIIAASLKFSEMVEGREDHKGAKGYLIFTETGVSANLLSRYRPTLPIFAFSDRDRESVSRRMSLSWGVNAFNIKLSSHPAKNVARAIALLKENALVKNGDNLIVIFGSNVGVAGTNNSLSIVTV